MKLSKHLTVKEMRCKCCGICEVDPSIIDRHEVARCMMNVMYGEHGEIRSYITSGCRCVEHNRNENGYIDSQHITLPPGEFPVKDSSYFKNKKGFYVPLSNEGICRAIDGYFYWTHNFPNHPAHNRVDPAPVLTRMYQDGLIRGVVLYGNNRFHADMRLGRRYFSDRRGK